MKLSKLLVAGAIGFLVLTAVFASLRSVRADAYRPAYDLNHDGIVDLRDIGMVARVFGSQVGGPTAGVLSWSSIADVDGNGVVDMIDVALVARHFTCPSFKVPEIPFGTIAVAAGSFAALGLFMVAKRPRLPT